MLSGGIRSNGPGNPLSNVPNLRQFDMNTIQRNANIFITGKRNSGKSNYLKHWLTYIANPKRALVSKKLKGSYGKIAVISATEKYNHFYRDEIGVDPDFIANDYDSEFLFRLLKMQQYLAERIPEESRRNLKHWLLIILDDIAFEPLAQKDKSLREFMFNGRHMMTCIVQLAQNACTPELQTRGCYDYVMCTRDNTKTGQKRLNDHYYGLFSPKQFNAAIMRYTSNHAVLIADNTVSKSHVTDQYFWDRAPDFSEANEGGDPFHGIRLDYSDTKPFRKFLKRRHGVSDSEFDDPEARMDILDSELKQELTSYYEKIDASPTPSNVNNNIDYEEDDDDDNFMPKRSSHPTPKRYNQPTSRSVAALMPPPQSMPMANNKRKYDNHDDEYSVASSNHTRSSSSSSNGKKRRHLQSYEVVNDSNPMAIVPYRSQ